MGRDVRTRMKHATKSLKRQKSNLEKSQIIKETKKA